MISKQEYKEQLLAAIDDMDHSILDRLHADSFGHVSRHDGAKLSDADMITRIIDENKDQISIFDTDEDMDQITRDVLYYKIDDIVNWLYSNWYDPSVSGKNADMDYSHYACSVNFGDVIGRGFDSTFTEFQTQHLMIVLGRDDSRFTGNEFGFYIKTMYPDLTTEPILTGRHYSKEEIIAKKLYQTSSVVRRVAFQVGKVPGYEIMPFDNVGQSPSLRITTNTKNGKYHIYLHPYDLHPKAQLSPVQTHGQVKSKIKLSLREVQEQVPGLIEVVAKAYAYMNPTRTLAQDNPELLKTERPQKASQTQPQKKQERTGNRKETGGKEQSGEERVKMILKDAEDRSRESQKENGPNKDPNRTKPTGRDPDSDTER